LGFPPGRTVDANSRLTQGDWITVALTSVVLLALVFVVELLWGFVNPAQFGITPFQACLYLLGAAALFVVGRHFTSKNEAADALTSVEIQRIAAILIMGVFVVFFWMGFEQAGGTMNLFADKQTDRVVMGWEVPAGWFQSLNPIFIVMLGPLFTMFWFWLDTSRYRLSTPAKLGWGMIILGLGFIVLAIAQSSADANGPVGSMWLVIVYLLHTMGELCLSPVGLSMVTKLAPARLVSLMMGIWYTANFVANYFAGILENLLNGSGIPLYWFLVGSSIGAGVLMILITPLIKKLMHGAG
jgi:proton-dependent oligopeptide transporter, POT family